MIVGKSNLTTTATVMYLVIMVVLPLSALISLAADLGWTQFVTAATAPRAMASYKLSVVASFIAASINCVVGLLAAWVLGRYRFPGRRVLDALIDIPFALPTAVAGIALTALYAPNGWVGSRLDAVGVKVAYTRAGIIVALTFIGFPFVVRSVQPVLASLERELEEAAMSLGASWWQTIRRVVLPMIAPALVSGFALAFARALGEYGSVVFIAGNMPMRTEIPALLIATKLDQFDYAGAAAMAVVMLSISVVMLLVIHALERQSRRFAA